MSELQRLESKIDRLDKKLTAILGGKKKQVWVIAEDIMRLTGWNKGDMYRMRKSGNLTFKKIKTTYLYDAESIPDIFIKKPTP